MSNDLPNDRNEISSYKKLKKIRKNLGIGRADPLEEEKDRLRELGIPEEHLEILQLPTDEQKKTLHFIASGRGSVPTRDLRNIVMRHPDTGKPICSFKKIPPGYINFSGAVFEDLANFDGSNFQSSVSFSGCYFHDQAGFHGTVFEQNADFSNVIFNHGATFQSAHFKGSARFAYAEFIEKDSQDKLNTASFFNYLFVFNWFGVTKSFSSINTYRIIARSTVSLSFRCVAISPITLSPSMP